MVGKSGPDAQLSLFQMINDMSEQFGANLIILKRNRVQPDRDGFLSYHEVFAIKHCEVICTRNDGQPTLHCHVRPI